MTAQDFLLEQQIRNILMQHLVFLLKKYSGLLVVTPTCPMPDEISNLKEISNKILRKAILPFVLWYVWIANRCGNPAISFPVEYVDPVEMPGEGRFRFVLR